MEAFRLHPVVSKVIMQVRAIAAGLCVRGVRVCSPQGSCLYLPDRIGQMAQGGL